MKKWFIILFFAFFISCKQKEELSEYQLLVQELCGQYELEEIHITRYVDVDGDGINGVNLWREMKNLPGYLETLIDASVSPYDEKSNMLKYKIHLPVIITDPNKEAYSASFVTYYDIESINQFYHIQGFPGLRYDTMKETKPVFPAGMKGIYNLVGIDSIKEKEGTFKVRCDAEIFDVYDEAWSKGGQIVYKFRRVK